MWESRDGRLAAVRSVWRARVEESSSYLVPGTEHWGISFVRRHAAISAELDGPRLDSRTVESVEGEEYWGVELSAFVVVPGASKQTVMGGTQQLPVVDGLVLLGERAVPAPAFDGLEAWVERLIDVEALRVDDEIRAALSQGVRVGASGRTWQRRFRHSVGLTAKQVEQVRRAERAYALLQTGSSPAEVAAACGFSDQPHLTRSLRLIRGRTPASILASARARAVRD